MSSSAPMSMLSKPQEISTYETSLFPLLRGVPAGRGVWHPWSNTPLYPLSRGDLDIMDATCAVHCHALPGESGTLPRQVGTIRGLSPTVPRLDRGIGDRGDTYMGTHLKRQATYLTARDLGGRTGTFPYEIMTRMRKRQPVVQTKIKNKNLLTCGRSIYVITR
jgi:hypothetical protein